MTSRFLGNFSTRDGLMSHSDLPSVFQILNDFVPLRYENWGCRPFDQHFHDMLALAMILGAVNVRRHEHARIAVHGIDPESATLLQSVFPLVDVIWFDAMVDDPPASLVYLSSTAEATREGRSIHSAGDTTIARTAELLAGERRRFAAIAGQMGVTALTEYRHPLEARDTSLCPVTAICVLPFGKVNRTSVLALSIRHAWQLVSLSSQAVWSTRASALDAYDTFVPCVGFKAFDTSSPAGVACICPSCVRALHVLACAAGRPFAIGWLMHWQSERSLLDGHDLLSDRAHYAVESGPPDALLPLRPKRNVLPSALAQITAMRHTRAHCECQSIRRGNGQSKLFARFLSVMAARGLNVHSKVNILEIGSAGGRWKDLAFRLFPELTITGFDPRPVAGVVLKNRRYKHKGGLFTDDHLKDFWCGEFDVIITDIYPEDDDLSRNSDAYRAMVDQAVEDNYRWASIAVATKIARSGLVKYAGGWADARRDVVLSRSISDVFYQPYVGPHSHELVLYIDEDRADVSWSPQHWELWTSGHNQTVRYHSWVDDELSPCGCFDCIMTYQLMRACKIPQQSIYKAFDELCPEGRHDRPTLTQTPVYHDIPPHLEF